MTKGKQAGGERQGEDECVCRDDRGKDRYGGSVTVPTWVRKRRQRQIMKTETGVSDERTSLCDQESNVYESRSSMKQ